MPRSSNVDYVQLRDGVRLEERNGRRAIVYGNPKNPEEIIFDGHEDFNAARAGKPRPSHVRQLEAAARRNEFANRQAMLEKLGRHEAPIAGMLWDIYDAAFKRFKKGSKAGAD
jgi:hypothetical protein